MTQWNECKRQTMHEWFGQFHNVVRAVVIRLYAVYGTNRQTPAGMQHVPIVTLVVITVLQLCRAQSSNSTPEWYAANDINDTNFSPKPITELFSTETSFSPEDPIVVLSPSSSLPSNRGIVSSPTPITLYNDSTDNQPPPNVIPLSSTEQPLSPPETLLVSQITSSDSQPQSPSTIPQESSTESNLISGTTQDRSLLNQAPAQLPRNNIAQIVRQNQQPLVPNRVLPQQMQPRNIQFLLPTQSGNRIFQGQQLTSNGQPNVFVLYEQAPQNIRNIPPANLPMPPQSPSITLQPLLPLRDSQPQIAPRPPNMVLRQQPPVPNQFLPQPNSIPPSSMPQPNIIISPQQNNQQQTGQMLINQVPTNNQQLNIPVSNQVPINQIPNVQQTNSRNLQLTNQITSPPVGTVLRRRPLRRRNRVNSTSNNRGSNRSQTSNTLPCQGVNNTVINPSAATNTQNPVITIRLRPSTMPRNSLQINPIPNTNRSTTVRPRQNSQANIRNYERCMNSCRDRKDRICAAPERDVQINPDTLKGFPSMCHMACHNTFRANPIYERIANGRCGKLRTRIQTVDKSKIRRDELKKSQYTIISNIPGTVVELAP